MIAAMPHESSLGCGAAHTATARRVSKAGFRGRDSDGRNWVYNRKGSILLMIVSDYLLFYNTKGSNK